MFSGMEMYVVKGIATLKEIAGYLFSFDNGDVRYGRQIGELLTFLGLYFDKLSFVALNRDFVLLFFPLLIGW